MISSMYKRLFAVSLCVSSFALSAPALAQNEQEAPNLDALCPVPYTVERQQTIAQAYVELTSKIGTALPVDLPEGALDAYYDNVRSIIAGEALQALADVRAAYVCRLKVVLPENKHKHIDAIAREVSRVTAQAFLPDNYGSIEKVGIAYDYIDSRSAAPLASFAQITAQDRVTSEEILAVLGSQNFQERSQTRMGIEARFGAIGVGGCLGTVRASLATLDNASIAALAAQAEVLSNVAEDDLRYSAYERILLDGQSIFAPGTTTQIAAQMGVQGDREALRSCLIEGSEEAPQVINQTIEQNATISAPDS